MSETTVDGWSGASHTQQTQSPDAPTVGVTEDEKETARRSIQELNSGVAGGVAHSIKRQRLGGVSHQYVTTDRCYLSRVLHDDGWSVPEIRTVLDVDVGVDAPHIRQHVHRDCRSDDPYRQSPIDGGRLTLRLCRAMRMVSRSEAYDLFPYSRRAIRTHHKRECTHPCVDEILAVGPPDDTDNPDDYPFKDHV